MNIIEKSLKYRQVTLSVLAVLFVFGVYSLLRMPRREDPKVSVPQALVVAYYPGASSDEVEQQVTRHIEEFLFKFEEIKKANTTSSSQNGKVVITVELNDNVDDKDLFWNKLRNELLVMKQQKLPSGVVGPVVNSEFGDTEALIIGLSGENIPYDQLRRYARMMEEDLRLVPSVSKIKRDGERDMQISILFDSSRLAQYGLTLSGVVDVIQADNEIYPAGNLKSGGTDIVFHANGTFRSTEQLAERIVGMSKTGRDVRLKDIARIERDYEEPGSMVKVGKENAVIVSIESMAGKNIEDFGKDVGRALEKFKSKVPSSVHLTYISDQPQIVHTNISHFIREFFIAIVAVILIIMLMLPFRIALVASMAIPMTVATTLAVMNISGIELQQVSLAALITVLGLVVDDAIVVADNYVELLDEGHTRWEAAWKSASDLVVPILVATLTIIFSFMPMVILTGAIGEFIRTLPLTVSIALASSFVVAMFFTPFLCLVFVKKGLHDTEAAAADRKKGESTLDRIQNVYNKALDWCMAHKVSTVILGIVPVVLAGILFKFGIRQQFMPSAERNQFVMELWMPTGTQIEATEAAARKLTALLDDDDRVVNHATFVGTSAPRFYYNLSPEFPTSNFAQIIVNTTSNETTLEIAAELTRKVEEAVPEGRPKVRLMQQGKPLKAQVEVRIWGEDIAKLKAIGMQVDSILRRTRGTAHVRSDFHEDYYTIDFRIKPEAQRLGFNTKAVALQVYGGFTGIPITTIREGNSNVTVLARLDTAERQSASDIRKMYITSPVTGKSVPFGQVAECEPAWKNGRIMHRSGINVLTMESETDGQVLASEILKEIKPQIAALNLPAGYSVTYGGEEANQNETFPELLKALGIGLLLIFFVLLLQFQNLKETFVILLTIPLSVFGAMFGLWVTGNNFGFSSFVGVICLSGIVVRNSIILIDHIHELVSKQGMDWATATVESGKRRLRPIFLTAMAAAFGVIPMILSGSSLWSPLASIIAFGVVWSMFVALLVVPVIYILWIVPARPKGKVTNTVAVMLLLLAFSSGANAQTKVDSVSLDDMITQALEKNNMLHISKLKISEVREKEKEMRIKRYPSLNLNYIYMYRFDVGELSFPAGALGTFNMPTGAELSIPQFPVSANIGRHNTVIAGVSLYQPLTSQWKLSSVIR
ncbi:MAG: efflux RND transporter permease subunit, partial [Prevotella sp.]